jgi:tripartite-type tricarboxylate transporter receptor subunit TctC
MTISRRNAVAGLGVASVLGIAARLSAQPAFPSKPMTLVIPFPAGGPSDVFGRHLAQAMTSGSASRWWSRTRAAGGRHRRRLRRQGRQ